MTITFKKESVSLNDVNHTKWYVKSGLNTTKQLYVMKLKRNVWKAFYSDDSLVTDTEFKTKTLLVSYLVSMFNTTVVNDELVTEINFNKSLKTNKNVKVNIKENDLINVCMFKTKYLQTLGHGYANKHEVENCKAIVENILVLNNFEYDNLVTNFNDCDITFTGGGCTTFNDVVNKYYSIYDMPTAVYNDFNGEYMQYVTLVTSPNRLPIVVNPYCTTKAKYIGFIKV